MTRVVWLLFRSGPVLVLACVLLVAGCSKPISRLWGPNAPIVPAESPSPAEPSAGASGANAPAEVMQVTAAPPPSVEVASISPPTAPAADEVPLSRASPTRAVVRPSGEEVVVPAGMTLYAIARENDVAVRDLIELNRLVPPYHLLAGQRLKIPTERTYKVQPGDTLYGVARRFGLDIHTLVQRNDLAPPYTLVSGTRLKLPSPVEPITQPAEEAGVAVASVGRAVPKPPQKPIVEAARSPDAEPRKASDKSAVRANEPPPRAGEGFYWPVKGKVISRFGSQGGGVQHDGIVIAAPRGAPVRASENGVVAYAGSDIKAYGKLLLIRHADGWMTAYAYNDELLVGEGDIVRKGETIARAGSAGAKKSAETYFEIRQRGKPVDPLPRLTEG